jgi:CysZ protein
MFAAFSKAIAQLPTRSMRRVLWLSIAISAVVFVVLWFAAGWILLTTRFFTFGLLDFALDIVGGFAGLVVTWLLFPAVVSMVTEFLLEDVADAVEERHYPHLGPVATQTLRTVLMTSLRFALVVVVINLVALPFYLVLLLVPPFNLFVFYAVNGYLLSREYFELVALRRTDMAEARELAKSNRVRLFATGVVIAFLLTVPFVNLLAPIIGTAVMVHLFEQWRQAEGFTPVRST